MCSITHKMVKIHYKRYYINDNLALCIKLTVVPDDSNSKLFQERSCLIQHFSSLPNSSLPHQLVQWLRLNEWPKILIK